MESLQVIAIEGDRHNAFRSRLGWCVVWPLPEGKDEYRFQFNGISIKNWRTRKVAGHEFAAIYCRDDIGDLF